MARRALVLALGVGALGALAAPALLRPAPRLVWNASASAPVGLWRIAPGEVPAVGGYVAAIAPPAARLLAARRGYLPANVPIIKTVAAAGGDLVCTAGPRLLVNGVVVAERRKADARGRPLPWWQGCRRLEDGAVLVLSPSADGFDSRYFGPVSRTAVIGKATPLWLP